MAFSSETTTLLQRRQRMGLDIRNRLSDACSGCQASTEGEAGIIFRVKTGFVFAIIPGVVKALISKFSTAPFFQKLLLALLLMGALVLPAAAQDKPLEAIAAAIRSGNAASVSRYFGPSVDITINNSSSTYSRSQGEQVLRDFFSRHPVRDFMIDYAGNSTSSDSRFSIGTLRTETCKFKVYLFLRPTENGYTLKELRIEK
jgi:hypothetical protein